MSDAGLKPRSSTAYKTANKARQFWNNKILLCVLCVLCGESSAAALDREAFTFVRWDLEARIAPLQQELSVRGKVMLRNDSERPQRHAVLQVSSSLEWRAVRVTGKSLPFEPQNYVSDLDHTGSLSEAVVTLPQEVAPGASMELEVEYEGKVTQDATRLTRLGTPEESALRTDWDRISESFMAVRGIGYVAWYPIATESASLAEGNEVFQMLGDWKRRHAESAMRVTFQVDYPQAASFTVVSNGKALAGGGRGQNRVTYEFAAQGRSSPAFVVAGYRALLQAVARVYHLPGHEEAAGEYARVAAGLQPLVASWFGPPQKKFEVVELAAGGPLSTSKPGAAPALEVAPWESGAMLFTPLHTARRDLLEVALVHQMTHASLESFRLWIEEGAAHFAQALEREQQQGREAALEYMQRQLPVLVLAEKATAGLVARANSTAAGNGEPEWHPPSLITAVDEVLYRTKAMFVWWMLRDMVGDAALQRTLRAYRSEMDKSPAYVQSLVEKGSGRSLEWFFDDWVYRGRGLPDFSISESKARANLDGSFTVDLTVENRGTATAEVPVTFRTEAASVTKRLLVIAGDNEDLRVTVPAKPLDVKVNDGSVPESDMGNNQKAIEVPES
ncbi:MAG: hypothetical protein L0099_02610 [Acidobacteria bacterium]|nr:hypothetical protein [Acidobacteriota bacterium]